MHQEASAQLEYIGVQQWETVIRESQHSKSCTINIVFRNKKVQLFGIDYVHYLLKRVIICDKAK